MVVKAKIWIESKEFEDRIEFRVMVKRRYPKGLDRKGTYEDYLSYWEQSGSVGGRVPYVFYAYKNDNVFWKIFGTSYSDQRRIAIQKCDGIILNYKKDLEAPKIQVYER